MLLEPYYYCQGNIQGVHYANNVAVLGVQSNHGFVIAKRLTFCAQMNPRRLDCGLHFVYVSEVGFDHGYVWAALVYTNGERSSGLAKLIEDLPSASKRWSDVAPACDLSETRPEYRGGLMAIRLT
jgi:hypothetical protein